MTKPLAPTKALITKLQKKARKLPVNSQDTYLLSYPHLVSAISAMTFKTESDLHCASLMVYGWMPTIPDFHTADGEVEKALAALRKLKASNNPIPETADVKAISSFLNNSVVGTSKLLHFLNHEVYPIWDSRIQYFISGTKKPSGMQEPEKYIAYCELIQHLKEQEEMKAVIHRVREALSPSDEELISEIRALEYLMFMAGEKQVK